MKNNNRLVRGLDEGKVLETADRLARRIEERFPGRGLVGVGKRVAGMAAEVRPVSTWLERPIWRFRLLAGAVTVCLIALLLGVVALLGADLGQLSFAEFLQTLEAGVNDAIFLAIAVYFFGTLERRHKRRKALAILHEIRSLAHIVDMHQMTKDPDLVVAHGAIHEPTPSSPVRDLSPYQMKRYFDYCSEMLSILSKLAALLVQRFDDPVVLNAVNEVESLTNGLSRKIWQKIMITSQQADLTPEPDGEAEAPGT